MPSLDLIDHSPSFPDPAPKLHSARNCVLIDNYDSFTWNVYQYLVLEGANVTVVRNDKCTLEELIAMEPTQLVVSPGPGHPETDSGISKSAILHFGGKIPILGVCMGEQCIYSAFGGRVDVTGEILHGKTSPLRHDGKGMYAGVDQDIPVTRYHSLAGTHPTLPDVLEITSWIAAGPDGGRGVIMGVRHKQFTIEGVQFHPESILSADGRPMLKNFLKMQGGTWEESKKFAASTEAIKTDVPHHVDGLNNQSATPVKKSSILERIYDQRRIAVAAQKKIPSQRPSDFEAAYRLHLAPPQINFPQRLKQSKFPLSMMAEIKRASPSKGIISISTCAPEQARKYALGGASVISVLTEPEWFKGNVEDLRSVRQALEGMPNRPAVLRKEFIFDEYQILEARLAGADTVLLIVKMLDEATLKKLYLYSQSLGMEPLVEVQNEDEVKTALNLGAKVIGVNNRNLVDFEVDMGTTTRLLDLVPRSVTVCALSGIAGPKDVEAYQKSGVGAVLVGEALMKAPNAAKFIEKLLTPPPPPPVEEPTVEEEEMLVKICGTRTVEAATAAIQSGADLVGIILAEGRSRTVPEAVALEISNTVRTTRKPKSAPRRLTSPAAAQEYFEFTTSTQMVHPTRALLVGVFQNQPLDYILAQQKILDLDIVQLHGDEPVEWSKLIPVPVIKSFSPEDAKLGLRGYHSLPLLDAGNGGSGEQLSTIKVADALWADRGVQIILAGGLNPGNIQQTLKNFGPLRRRIKVVDVSSGVETDGVQDLAKIGAFIKAVKTSATPA